MSEGIAKIEFILLPFWCNTIPYVTNQLFSSSSNMGRSFENIEIWGAMYSGNAATHMSVNEVMHFKVFS